MVADNTHFAAPPGTTLQDLLPLRNPCFPPTDLPFEFEPPWKLAHQFLSAVFACPSNGISTFICLENYARLVIVIYAVSNNLCHSSAHLELLCNLDSVFSDVPRKYLEALLRTSRCLASIRAAFETFLDRAAYYDQQDAFQFLVKIGATYGWLASSWKDHIFLSYAASVNLTSTLRTLLDNGCRPDSWIPDPSFPNQLALYPTAIVKALDRGNLENTQLLLEHCDVNKNTNSAPGTNFKFFLQKLDDLGEFSEIGLKLFLQAGADLEVIIGRPIQWTPCRISAMDYLFYFHRSLFNTLPKTVARVQNGYLSGAGILLSLEGGVQSLETYLGTLAPQLDRQQLAEVLKRLIVEQFLLCDLRHRKRDTTLETVHALVNSGLRFGAGIDEVLLYAPCILHQYVQLVGDDCDACDIEAAMYLVDHGATVTGEVLSWMARLPDQKPFDLVRGRIKNLKGLDIAIAHAAARNNFDAIGRLCLAEARFDTDFRITRDSYLGRTSIVASVIQNYRGSGLSQMLKHLVGSGAPLRLSEKKPHLHHLLQLILDFYNWERLGEGEIMDVVRYIVGEGYDPRNSPYPTAPLLEACRSTRVFEYLYQKGAQLRPGSPLATWISMGGGIELCREMLKAGAEPNAYSRDEESLTLRTPLQAAARECSVEIVELLLQEDSEVNAPAEGMQGYTALQATCGSWPNSLEGQEQKLRTIRLLLAHDADVNAAPACLGGKTALQEAAASGDLTVAKMLLFHNPMADVNAPPCALAYSRSARSHTEPRLGRALDYAAGNGRIDMVKLLLNCNALSHYREKTGYDGAIDEARDKGHFTIADLIQQHAEDVIRSGTSPDLSQPWRDHHEYGYKWGQDEGSEYSDDDQESAQSSDTDEPGLNEEDWFQEAVGHGSFDIHEGDPAPAALDPDVHNSTNSLSCEEVLAATADDTSTWLDQGSLSLTQDQDLTEI